MTDEGDPETHHDRLSELALSTLLTTFGMPAARIDRRPSLSSKPFDDVYFVELEHKKRAHSPVANFEYSIEEVRWLERVRTGIQRVKDVGGEATLLGVW